METRRVWPVIILLLCFQGSTDSQTDVTVTEIITVLDTEPTVTRTQPMRTRTLPPQVTGTPPMRTGTLPPLVTGTPPMRTGTAPPPPPPPSSPPPPPSTIIPPDTTVPPTQGTLPPTNLPTTVSMPITTVQKTLGPSTVPPMNPTDPTAVGIGRIGVILNVAENAFDEVNFRRTIAREVTNYCKENPCKGERQEVTPEHVIIINTCIGECQSVTAVLVQRKLLQTDKTQVNYYVQDPISSTNVMLTTEEQLLFLADDAVIAVLQVEIDFESISPDSIVIPPDDSLEGWEIALIVIGSVAFVCGVVGGIAGFMYYRKKQSGKDEMDFELQDPKLEEHDDTDRGNDYTSIGTTAVANGMNGNVTPKKKVEEVDFSAQVKYKEIIEETGYVQKLVNEKINDAKEKIEEAKENSGVPKSNDAGGSSIVVTADIASSSSSSSSQNDESEKKATSEEQQEEPPKYASDEETRKVEEETAAVVGELDNLVADQTKEGETAFENPAYDTVTDVDENGIAKTSL